nr:hypothetical protein BaRGS_030953 [Batillaria attramentaria]
MSAEIRSLKEENGGLQEENSELKGRLDDAESKIDDLEGRSRRNNILVHGLPRVGAQETWEQCEGALKDMFREKMELDDDFVMDRVHRLRQNDPNSPIIAHFAFSKDRERVMRAKQKLKGSNIFIGEDFSKRVREVRKKLSPFLKKVRDEGKRCKMVFDHLIIDGKHFHYNPNTADIEEAST